MAFFFSAVSVSLLITAFLICASAKCWPRSCPRKRGRDSRPTHLHFVQHPSARIYENKFSCIARLVGVCPSSWSRQRSVVPHEAVQEPGELSYFGRSPHCSCGSSQGVTPTSGLSLTLFRGKASFARDGYENVVPQHQCVTRPDVINFPDLVAVETVVVAMLIGRRCLAAFRVSIV